MPTTDAALTDDDLSPAALLVECEDALLWRRAAEVRDLELVAHWAVLHGSDPKDDPTASRHDHLVQVGGEGTPMVRDLCIGDLALARQVGWVTARTAMADILDLQHRLPRTWALVRDFEAEAWVARKVAVLSRGLGIDTVGAVDAAVARAIAGEAPSRVLDIAQGKVIEADPIAHAHRVAVENAKRYVTTSRTDAHGLRHVIARVTAGDAVWIDATVHRVAEILRAQLDDAGVPPQEQPSTDVLRAEAFGWLARPAELLQLLLEAGTPTLVPADEDHGPLAAHQLTQLLRHTHVTVKPVIDLREAISVNAYEHPEALKERIWLLTGGDKAPYATGSSGRRIDYDHPAPWSPPQSPDGPPGQTGTHNSQPLNRRHHRWKTHTGVEVTQLAPGTYSWRTPHGATYLVDPTGTHRAETVPA